MNPLLEEFKGTGVDKLNLTNEQLIKIRALRIMTKTFQNLTSEDLKFLNDMCLFRFLKGFNWSVPDAAKNLKETIAWRQKYKPESIKYSDVQHLAKLGFVFPFGKDLQNRPIIYVLMEKDTYGQTKKDWEERFKLFVYMMEHVIKHGMDEKNGIYNSVFIIDMKGAKLNLNTIKEVKDMFIKLGDYYSERMAKAIILNAPFALTGLWNMIKVFVAKETVAKISFLKNKKWISTCHQIVHEDQLITSFNGKHNFNFNEFHESLLKEDSTIL